MADPLTVSASIVGLLTSSNKISESFLTVINNARHATQDFRKAQSEISLIQGILGQLQLFLLGVKRAPNSRTSLILVDQVVVVLSACVTTFSELDTFMEGMQSDAELKISDRLRWALKEKDIQDVLSRLQSHKSSLSLMLTILTCQQQYDAEAQVDQLCDLVRETLAQNAMLAARLADTDFSKADKERLQLANTEPAIPINTESGQEVQDPGLSNAGIQRKPTVRQNPYGFAFEEQLMNSRSYRNASHNLSDAFSAISSAGRTGSWSMLSGLSLSETSQIAILALPIYQSDIANHEAYDFDSVAAEPVPMSSLTNMSSNDSKMKKSGSRKQWFKDLVRREKPLSSLPDTPAEIFGVDLKTSIAYANVEISLFDEDGTKFLYGYIPLVVAKAGYFLKDKAVFVQDIFALSGNAARVMHLQQKFESKPTNYGRGLSWDGITVHDASAILLRYLKMLPEPVVPYHMYDELMRTMEPRFLRDDEAEIVGVEEENVVIQLLQDFVTKLPPSNRQLLLYLLDIMAVFVSKSDSNGMTSNRIVRCFQPSLISGPPDTMDAEAHDTAAFVAVFFVENQDHFLIGGELDGFGGNKGNTDSGEEPLTLEASTE